MVSSNLLERLMGKIGKLFYLVAAMLELSWLGTSNYTMMRLLSGHPLVSSLLLKISGNMITHSIKLLKRAKVALKF